MEIGVAGHRRSNGMLAMVSPRGLASRDELLRNCDLKEFDQKRAGDAVIIVTTQPIFCPSACGTSLEQKIVPLGKGHATMELQIVFDPTQAPFLTD